MDVVNVESQIKVSEEAIAELKKEEKQLVVELAKISVSLVYFPHTLSCLPSHFFSFFFLINNSQDHYDDAKEALQVERDKLVSLDRELQSLEAHKKAKDDEIHQSNLQVQQLEHDIQRFQKDRQTASAAVKHLEKTYPWIQDQKQ